MARRKRTHGVAPSTVSRLSAVQAIFDPAGDIHVRATAPSGTVYEIAPRVSFRIAGEDVDWFFRGWEYQHRQCLSRLEEYQPRRPQFDNGRASRTARVLVEPEPSVEPEPVTDEESVTEPVVAVEAVVVPEPNIEPEPVVEAGEGEIVEDKE